MIKEKIAKSNLDLTNLKEKHLSIQLSLDGFSFLIYDDSNEILVFSKYKFIGKSITPEQHLKSIEKLFSQEELLQHNYKTVKVCHFNNLVTQVPSPFFDENKLSQYLKFNIKVLENDYVTYDNIEDSEIVNVYVPFVNINNFLFEKYGSFIYKHSSTIFIEKILGRYKNTNSDLCFVNIIDKSFEIVIMKNSKLELFNCFSFNTKEDFIYYILFVAEQLNLDPEKFKLVLLGDIKKESELYLILYKYIRNIEFYKPPHFSPLLKEKLAEYSNFALFNQI